MGAPPRDLMAIRRSAVVREGHPVQGGSGAQLRVIGDVLMEARHEWRPCSTADAARQASSAGILPPAVVRPTSNAVGPTRAASSRVPTTGMSYRGPSHSVTLRPAWVEIKDGDHGIPPILNTPRAVFELK